MRHRSSLIHGGGTKKCGGDMQRRGLAIAEGDVDLARVERRATWQERKTAKWRSIFFALPLLPPCATVLGPLRRPQQAPLRMLLSSARHRRWVIEVMGGRREREGGLGKERGE